MNERRVVGAVIRGRVQGVGFRAWVAHRAQLHGLAGWVRNRRDGTVEAVFAGPADLVEVMVKTCREGPRGSRVDGVELDEEDESALADAGLGGFEILPTV